MRYLWLSKLGYETADFTAAFLLDSHGANLSSIFPTVNVTELAFKFWSRSAHLGNTDAMMQIGDHHYYGMGTPHSIELAIRSYRDAAAAGNVS